VPHKPYNPKAENNKQLADSHRIFHSWIANLRKSKKDKYGSYTIEDIWNMHRLGKEEMQRRRINHNKVDPFLDAEKMPTVKLSESVNPKLAQIHGGLDSFVLIPDFVCVVGGTAEGREDTEDIDVVIKSANRNTEIESRIAEQPAFKKIFPSLHIIYDKSGSHGLHAAAYDLVLVKREQPTIQQPEYSFPLFGAAPEKARLPGDSTGLTAYLHRDGDECKTMTADGEEIPEFPQVRTEALKIEKPMTFILAGYLDSDGKFAVRDIFRWNSTELVESSEIDRQFFLDKFLWTENIYRFPQHIEMEFEEKIQLMKPFQPLKTRSGYGEFEFNKLDELINKWAVLYFKSNKAIAVQPKFDGHRITWNKSGSEVKGFTEDKKRNRAPNLPEISEEIRKLAPKELILDTEVILKDEDGKFLPRHKGMAIVAAKGEVRNAVAFVHDCLWYDKPINELPYSERMDMLKKAIPKDTEWLKVSPTWYVKNDKELRDAAAKASKFPTSEGGMFKVADSPYTLSGRTPFWAKWKMIKELTVKVIGIRRKVVSGKPTDTFLYRGAFLKDKSLEPFYSQHILGPKDMQEESEWEMGLGFKRGRPGDQAYAETYGSNVKAKIGDLLTVLPIHILKFQGKDGKERFAWMFPRVRNVETAKDKPDSLEDVEGIVAMSEGSAKMKLEDFLINLTEDMFPITIEEVQE